MQNEKPSVWEAAAFAIVFGGLITAVFFIIGEGGGEIAKNAKEARQKASEQILTIEGEVASVEIKKVPDPFDEPKKGIRIRFESHEPDRVIIKFADGREKEFFGIYEKPIPNKGYVIITYDGNNKIKSIAPKEPDNVNQTK